MVVLNPSLWSSGHVVQAVTVGLINIINRLLDSLDIRHLNTLHAL